MSQPRQSFPPRAGEKIVCLSRAVAQQQNQLALCSFCLARNLVGECLPQALHVVASSVSLALPKSSGLAHSAVPPFPHKVLGLCGAPNKKYQCIESDTLVFLYSNLVHVSCFFYISCVMEMKESLKIAQQSCRNSLVICTKRRNFKF